VRGMTVLRAIASAMPAKHDCVTMQVDNGQPVPHGLRAMRVAGDTAQTADS
jgi:hypothetical protein